jgi:hypothetical protein
MHVQAKSNAQITVPLNGETTVQWKSIDIFLNIKGDCPTHAKKTNSYHLGKHFPLHA